MSQQPDSVCDLNDLVLTEETHTWGVKQRRMGGGGGGGGQKGPFQYQSVLCVVVSCATNSVKQVL